MADFDYTRLTEAIMEGLNRADTTREAQRRQQDEDRKRRDDITSQRNQLRSTVQELKKFRDVLKDGSSMASKFEQLLKNGNIAIDNHKKELEKLDEQIKKVTDAKKKEQLQSQRDSLAAKARTQGIIDSTLNFTASVVKTGATFAQEMGAVANNLVRSLQSGGGSAAIFGNVFSGIINSLKTSVTALGSAFGAAGTAIGNLFPKYLGKGVGVIAQALGQSIGLAASVIGTTLVAGIEILVQEIEKTINAYATMNRAGAVFAGGMTEMRNTAHSAGLTLETLSRVVSQNSEAIAKAGLGVTEGTKRIASALRVGGETLRNELLSLGYSIEEQGSLVAETMRGMAGLAGPLRATDQEVAIETRKYAENLRIISAITGEDAKKKMEQARRDMDNLRFQQTMNKLSESQRLNVKNAMDILPDFVRKMAIEIANTGTIYTKELAFMAGETPELAKLARNIAEGAKSGTLDLQQVLDMIAQNRDAIFADIQRQRDLATAGVVRGDSIAGAAAKGYLELMKDLQNLTPESIKAAKETTPKAAEAYKTDAITGAIVSIQKSANDLKVVLETEITNLMGTFAKALKDNVETIAQGIKALADAFRDKGIVEGLKELTKQVGNVLETATGTGAKDLAGAAGGLVGAGVGGLVGAGVGSTVGKALAQKPAQAITQAGVKRVVGGVLGAAGSLLGGGIASVLTGAAGYMLGDYLGEKIYDAFFADTEKRASGGPVNRNTPYIVGEKGPELRVFEKDGAIVPTNMLMDLLKGTGGSLASLMYDMQRSVNSQTFTTTLEEFAVSLTRFVNNLSDLIADLEVPRTTQIINADGMLTASVSKELSQMGMLVAKSSVDQQNFLGDLREVMQEITNSATTGSEKAAAEITAQLRKTVGDLTLPTTVSKDPNVIDLRRTMQDQNSLQEMSVRQQYEMLSVLNEMRSIQQQILSNST